jgi:hypothetical protein
MLRVRGMALLALDRLDEADAALLEARAVAASQPSYRALWMICPVLAQVALRRGQPAQAREWWSEARRHLDYLIAHIEEPDLRASFLAQPEVRATLEAEA